MKILWLVNIPLPEVSLIMGKKPRPFGGWLIRASQDISSQKNHELLIAFPSDEHKSISLYQGESIKYIAFPRINEDNVVGNKDVHDILEMYKPDIVHIFGTEFSHALAMVNGCNENNIKSVISIQGLVSIYAIHYMASLPADVQKRYTLKDFLRRKNLIKQQASFFNQGKLEIEAISKVKHVIGRTTWDRACTLQINPQLNYHHCNETLRDAFYEHRWDFGNCERHSIFISQATYPIKGLHFVLEALPMIIKKFPDVKLYIAGTDAIKSDSMVQKIKMSSYTKYINDLINKNNLINYISFTGVLSEIEMCERYLKSNVFVCPSSIENSPNSLGEAMILGVPCIASDVGGISDMIIHKEEGFLYQSDAPYMLAHYVCELFEDQELKNKLSNNARKHALITHDRELNLQTILRIYNDIVHNS